jgi:hypothetical protein
MKPRMTVAQYAKHRRCSRQAIYKALSECRITREPDGSIDPAKADAQWLANTSPASRWTTSGGDVALSPADIERICGGCDPAVLLGLRE